VDIHPDPDRITDAHSIGYTNRDRLSNAYTDSFGFSNQHSERDPYTHSGSDEHSHSHIYPFFNLHRHADTDPYQQQHTYPGCVDAGGKWFYGCDSTPDRENEN
jgi:hypothetical protein